MDSHEKRCIPRGDASAAYVLHCRETVRPMLRRWSDRMMLACALAAALFAAMAIACAINGHWGGWVAMVAALLAGAGLAFMAIAWRMFSVAALQMLQLLEMAAAGKIRDRV